MELIRETVTCENTAGKGVLPSLARLGSMVKPLSEDVLMKLKKTFPALAAVCELQLQPSAATKDHYWLLMMTSGPAPCQFHMYLAGHILRQHQLTLLQLQKHGDELRSTTL